MNRGVLWRKVVFTGFKGKPQTRQCIVDSNKFPKCCLVFGTVPFTLSLFFLLLPSHSLPVVFFCTTVDTYIHLYLCGGKKRQVLFFPSCVVLSLTHLSPPRVLCLLSHQWNIDESTEHVSNPHVWCWGVLQGRLLFPLQVGVAVCACGLWVIRVCLFLIHFVWISMTDPNPISKKRVTSWLVHCKLCMCYSWATSVGERGGIISPVTAQRSNISTFYHKTTSESLLGRSVTSEALTAARIQHFLPSLRT